MPWFPGSGGGGGGSGGVTGATSEGSGTPVYDTMVNKVLKFRSVVSVDPELVVTTTPTGEVQLDLDLSTQDINGGSF